ncbi:HD domain-containing protein [Streptomyces tibetensis]|uniref:HD domain-containing protein n=1 Tax=Streptomyces tibetensis TaxID=2382123 RepID=A0ABW6NDD0_9ACTN
MGLSPGAVERVSRLWGKSAARHGGRKHLLLGHLLDTAAVAGVMWDWYVSAALRRRLPAGTGPGRPPIATNLHLGRLLHGSHRAPTP